MWQKDQLRAGLRRVVNDPQEIEAVVGDGVTERDSLQIQITEHAPFDRPLLAQGGRHHHDDRARVRVLDRDARSDRERRVRLPQTDLVGEDLPGPVPQPFENLLRRHRLPSSVRRIHPVGLRREQIDVVGVAPVGHVAAFARAR